MRSGTVSHLRASLAIIALLILTSHGGWADERNLEKVEFDEASLEEIFEFFRRGGGDAARATNILVDPKVDQSAKVTLVLRDVSLGEAFAYVAELGGFDYREETHAVRIFPPRKGAPDVKAFLKRGGTVTWRRASEMHMPKVEFDGVELAQVISDLTAASRQLDPKKKGLNLVLGRGVDASTPVSLQLQNVPVSTVLKYVAEFARLNLRADGPAIVFTPRAKVGQ